MKIFFCTKEVLKIVSEKFERNPVDDFTSVAKFIFKKLRSELDNQVSLHVSSEIKFQLNMFDANQKGATNIATALTTLLGNINTELLYAQTMSRFNDVLETEDYDRLLALYNRKTLPAQISSQLGLANQSLPETIVRLAKGSCRNSIKSALMPYFGNFQQHMMA